MEPTDPLSLNVNQWIFPTFKEQIVRQSQMLTRSQFSLISSHFIWRSNVIVAISI